MLWRAYDLSKRSKFKRASLIVPGFFRHIVRPLLFKIPPEQAHTFTLWVLKTMPVISILQNPSRFQKTDIKTLQCSVANIVFPNPLGMAAGFDKNAEVTDQILKLGYGFVEAGTLTPLPQLGNAPPRLFRLAGDKAIINRMGFNNDGYQKVFQKLSLQKKQGILGINIGANKDSINRIADYKQGIDCFYNLADYFTINISSPNTPNLRALQTRENLRSLLASVLEMRQKKAEETKHFRPVFLKIAPDLTEKEMDVIACEILSSKLDGLVVSNTTLSRSEIQEENYREERGGLSGAPLFRRSTIILAKMRKRLGKSFPIIGVGGVENSETALEKIRAGADLVQLYSSFIYYGPTLIFTILAGLMKSCQKDGVKNILEYRDQTTQKWAERSLEP